MFIRTEKRIFDLEKLKLCYTEFIWEGDKLYLIDGCLNSSLKVIKQADTIEELCDEYVVEYNAGDKIDHLSYYSKGRMNFIWEGKEDRILAIYGAIWTNKGLIYVAKMNEKGELELL